ncbi:DUF5753 domain-containing protein [Dactylosporangium sp. NPDC049525]|uniref:DUF5753 domain-containing protein n=1 Tax=Dactylosporangium sp. NPDC049525 TaxID=3154730 RepID=UPI00341B110F
MADATRTHDVRDPAPFDRLTKVEPQAAQIFLNQPLFFPGLLQTRAYATAMISSVVGLELDSPELHDRVDARAQRAETLHARLQSDAPPHIWAAIDEGVVRRVVGGAAVWQEQLNHLVAMAKFDTVHLAIIPFDHGAHPGLGGSFEVHELPNGDASVFFEGAYADELIETDQDLARRHRGKVQRMVESGVDARELLATITAG